MTGDDAKMPSERRLIDTSTGTLEVFAAGLMDAGLPTVCAAHPAAVFGDSAAGLLREMAAAGVVCVNPRGLGASSPQPPLRAAAALASMVDDLESARRGLGVTRWTFWGMSGGGWLGLAYACAHPEALDGLILESVCPCFRLRLADPACILSPFHPAWRSTLEKAGLLDPDAHLSAGDEQETEWHDVANAGPVFRRRDGPALLVSPIPVSPELRAAMPLLWTIDFRESLQAIRTPTLVIGGSLDPIVPLPHLRSLREGIRGSRYLVVEGAQHVPTSARHREVAQAVRAFARCCRRPPPAPACLG
jgi:pimeloyl-ACP methyl ester carboxylesterase